MATVQQWNRYLQLFSGSLPAVFAGRLTERFPTARRQSAWQSWSGDCRLERRVKFGPQPNATRRVLISSIMCYMHLCWWPVVWCFVAAHGVEEAARRAVL